MNFDWKLLLPWVLRFSWVFIILQWVDTVRQFIGLRAVTIPPDVGSREAAKAAADNIASHTIFGNRVKSLLSAYAEGWSSSEVFQLAVQESVRSEHRSRTAVYFILLVCVACYWANVDQVLALMGIAALGATLFLRSLVLGRIDHAVETRLLTRLPASLPGAGITANDLGKALGASIENSFKQYVPQPEKFAASLAGALDGARKSLETAAAQLATGISAYTDKINASLSAGGDKMNSGLSTGADKLTSGLSTGAEKLTSGLNSGAEKLTSGLNSGADKIIAGLNSGAEKLSTTLSSGTDRIQATLGAQAQSIEKASANLAAQVERLMSIGKDIEKVLHVSQSVEGALKAVTASEEFKKTLTALQAHLMESDKLLREVSKPRTIRLVEHEGEISAQ